MSDAPPETPVDEAVVVESGDDPASPVTMADTGPESATADGPRTARNAAIAVGIVVAALILLLAFNGGGDEESSSALVGSRVPELTGTDLDGDPVDIDDLRGQWVVVNFFATWCAPCVAEHPELMAVDEWGRRRGDVAMLSVVFNEADAPVRRFFAERGGDWPVILGSTAAVDFRVAQIPETFIVAPNGVVSAHIAGQTTAEEVAALVDGASGGGG